MILETFNSETSLVAKVDDLLIEAITAAAAYAAIWADSFSICSSPPLINPSSEAILWILSSQPSNLVPSNFSMNSAISFYPNSTMAVPASGLIAISLISRTGISFALIWSQSLISLSISPKSKGMLLKITRFKSLPVTIWFLAQATALEFGAWLEEMLFLLEWSEWTAHWKPSHLFYSLSFVLRWEK